MKKLLANKTAVVIVVGAIIIGVAIALFTVQKPTTKKPAPIDRPVLKTPEIGSPPGVGINYQLNIKRENLNIPSQLPVYKIENQSISLQEATKIASGLGFQQNPDILDDVNRGQVISWRNSSSLKIVPSTQLIDYKSGKKISGQPSNFYNENQLKEVAVNFLKDNNLANPYIFYDKLQFIPISNYERIGSENNENNLYLGKLSFNESVGEYRIVNSSPGIGTISIIFDGSEIFSVFVDRAPKTSFVSSYKSLNYDEFVTLLPRASIKYIETNEQVLNENISSVAINNLEIAYLQDESAGQTVLQPILIIKGEAIFPSGKQTYAELYLPALAPASFLSP